VLLQVELGYMVSGLRHGAHYPNEELWTIASRWCGRLGVLVDWWRAKITTICCVVGFQSYGWTSSGFSW
jgi:hypothetical protein